MTNAERLKDARIAAGAEGKCYVCRSRPAKVDCVTCQVCLDRSAASRAKNVANGLCRCGKALTGAAQCERCLVAQRRRNARLYVKRKREVQQRIREYVPVEFDKRTSAGRLAAAVETK